jgi:2-succinyl-5-enolpyruvyl-6-hydroxy-3-cyclohexene-1-carboxylate synthase
LERAGPTQIVEASPAALARALVERGPGPTPTTADAAPWAAWVRDEPAAQAALRSSDDDDGAVVVDEPWITRRVVAGARATGARLFVGNSTPIRAVDRFCPTAPRVLANRGSSGIDGLVSTAAGVALAAGPTVALLGDLSFLHDAGSLSALARLDPPLRVVVVDNGGGGIFDFLPIARHEDLLERFFTTPHAVDLTALVRAYGVPTVRVDDAAGLAARLQTSPQRLEVVVVPVARADNVARHRRRGAQVRAALERGR